MLFLFQTSLLQISFVSKLLKKFLPLYLQHCKEELCLKYLLSVNNGHIVKKNSIISGSFLNCIAHLSPEMRMITDIFGKC